MPQGARMGPIAITAFDSLKLSINWFDVMGISLPITVPP